jgi:protein-S-isoprenylcysteine O-methyltransferase Ste14
MSTQPSAEQTRARIRVRTIVRAVVGFTVFLFLAPVVMFVAAGDWRWGWGWIYVGLSLMAVVLSRVIAARKNPNMLAERARFTEHQDAKPWDRVLMPLVGLYGPLVLCIVIGLDRRWQWSPPLPLALQLTALVVVASGMALFIWAFVANQFFSAVVRIQKDREHAVVTSGPYRFVRHPGYAGTMLSYVAGPVMLGTLWAFIPAALQIAALVVRTELEDKTLLNELDGYREYAGRVRYRLIPGIW